MKRMKKIVSVLLALVMMFALSLTAFAAGTASITITGAVNGETYTAYKLFDVTKSTSGDAYSYFTTSEDLKNALADLDLTFTESADKSEWIVDQTKNDKGEVVFGKKDAAKTMTAAELAVAINTEMTKETSDLKTALGTGQSATASISEGATAASATISNLDAGYYFVDSSLGSLCALNTATETVQINEKNSKPSITKEVLEDSTGAYGATATIDIIDTIKYQLTVNTGTNTNGSGTGVDADYVIVDELPVGIAYTADSIAVKTGTGENATTWTAGTDYSITTETVNNKNKLTITLESTGELADLAQNTDIVITYDATVTADSITVGTAGNENTATLTYHSQSQTASATVYTYEIGGSGDGSDKPPFQKVDGGTTAKTPLAGVTFQLSRTVTKDNAQVTEYATVSDNYLTGWAATEANASGIVTDSNGAIDIKGLDAGTYILTETATLPGYNLLDDTITVTIADNGTVTYKLTSDTSAAQNTITVENSTGSLLPSTGGTGTTVLYTIGIVLVLGAGILLVVRRRMSVER